ncbi:MAG: DNA repair protein RadC [Chloroflexota bacterium]|nr:DNA repair protein RadC [Chloroflexota bacterium]
MQDSNGSPYLALRETPETDRPRERLKAVGAAYLSDAELLAILLRVGIKGENVTDLSRRLLAQHRGLTGLAAADFGELAAQRGVGEAKACSIKAALELGRRLLTAAPEQRKQISSPDDVADILILEMAHLEQEQMRVLHLNTKHQLIAMIEVYKGSLNSAPIRAADIFKGAVRNNAASVILAHNHPSGDPTPSPQDARTTELLVEAGRLLDIEVLDHLVVGRTECVSMRRRRLGFTS